MGDDHVRISDADRERVAGVLHVAVGEGRITWDEHEERLSAVYAARTRGEISPVLADLPVVRAGQPMPAHQLPARLDHGAPLRVALSSVRRRPDPAQGPVQVDVLLGAAEIDLRDLPRGAVVDVLANSFMGKVEIRLSTGTRLVDTGTASFGKRSTVESRRWFSGWRSPLRDDAPVVRLSGHSVLGHVRVVVG